MNTDLEDVKEGTQALSIGREFYIRSELHEQAEGQSAVAGQELGEEGRR